MQQSHSKTHKVNYPDTAMPCKNLSATNKIGAKKPIVWYVGKIPMHNVTIAIKNIESENAVFLPCLSPIWPNKIPPNGLAR